MSIGGIINQNQHASTQIVKQQLQNQTKTEKTVSRGFAGEIDNIPNLEQYEALIQRFLSGSSELESSNKPLTDDQVALRGLMREYQRTDTRTFSQVQANMQLASRNFFSAWQSEGNTGPRPGRFITADGATHIFNSKAEKDAFMKDNTMNFLRDAMFVINAGKNGGFDAKV